MTIEHPALLLTDLVLAVVASVLGWRLHGARPENQAARWWSRALGAVALAAVVGGFFHALAGNFAPQVQRSWWALTLLLTCSVGLAMDFSLLHIAFPAGIRAPWRAAVFVKFIAFASFAIVEAQFWAAIISALPSLLAWAVAALLRPYPWRGWMLAGIGLSILAAIVQVLHLSPYIDYNDLYHIIQAVALYGLFRAGLLFGNERSQAAS